MQANLISISIPESIWTRRMQAGLGMPEPLLKWAGKQKLLPKILERLPDLFHQYYEPFVGGLSIFFALYRNELVEQATLGDSNLDLMDTYRIVRTYPDLVMEVLKSWRHSRKRFNALCKVRRVGKWSPEDAARLIYLNHTCFHGLYQVNLHGEFVVPFGEYKKPEIYDKENIMAAAVALRNVTLYTGSFTGCLRGVGPGDFVYCNPPCGIDDKKSAELLDGLNSGRVKWMLSTSDTEWVRKRYKKYNIESVLGEVIVTNY